ncbi:MAG TPA: hypothetical protein VJS38_05010 [Phenylobacterium sp.]|uniref:hypothetical protein n=1 Tax=Phenylobacterium sp. TaxID=1871053 RepID=UPI002B48EC57|nr:hypothetical protein [Phenylobacterium sp.]HKR87513.1 hypothetical protein [Phenylobacterium sp.]
MSETLSLWSSQPPPLFRPQMMIGAATPLWGYFTGVALTGVALWWMSRWLPTPSPTAVAAAPPDPPVKAPEPVEAREIVPQAAAPDPDPAADPAPAPAVELIEEPVLDAEFVPAPPPPARPKKPKSAEAKPH